MFDVTFERPTGTGDTKTVEYTGVTDVLNVPMARKARVTFPDGSTDSVPCATVVKISEHEED
jgi:hypothetical protein